MSIQERVGISLDEFIRQYDEAPFELIDGGDLLPGFSAAVKALFEG